MDFGLHSRHLQPFFSVYIYAAALNVVTDSLEKVVITQINRALIYLIAFLFFLTALAQTHLGTYLWRGWIILLRPTSPSMTAEGAWFGSARFRCLEEINPGLNLKY